ncbi:MAG: peroxiredoxin family protein [Bacteroidia bacterium]|jgi:peroxiredoxin
MIKRVHVYTTLAFIFLATGLFLLQSELPALAPVYVLAGYLCAIKEVAKYTSWYQFSAVFGSAFVLGLILDKNLTNFPLLALSVFVAASGSIMRVVLFRVFCHTRYTWFEPAMLSVAVLLYLVGNMWSDNGWQAWVFPPVVLFFQGVFTFDVMKDEKQLLGYAMGANRVAIGKNAPDFELPDQDGELVSINDYKSRRNLLLIFVRGDWCPGCHMMLRTYQREKERFYTKDILVMAIGPDPVGVNREMVEKLSLDFKVLSDPGQKTAMRYGVQLKEYDNDFAEDYEEGIPLPASFLIDKNGLVQYASRPDRVGEFLDPRTIFPVVDKLGY